MSRFRLAGLLRVRTLQEEQARGRLGGAQVRLTAAQQHLLRSQALLAAAGPPTAGEASVFLASVASRAALASAVDAAVTLRATAGDELDGARSQWMQARLRARSIERLGERHEAEQAAELGRLEQAASDDLAGARHGRQGDRP